MSAAEDPYEKAIKLWAEGAKSCSQVAMAAMFLPVFWLREIGGIGDNPLGRNVPGWFYWAWISWLASIALAHTYQLSAIRLIITKGRTLTFPRIQYWLMLAALVVGTMSFAQGARDSLRKKGGPCGATNAASAAASVPSGCTPR